jgi:hypothetical protein
MTRLILFLLLWLGCCLYALLRGGAPERIGAGLFLIGAVASALLQSPGASHFQGVETGVLIVDAGLLVGFVILSLFAERFWPIWMSAMQAVLTLSHLAAALNPRVLPWGYWNAETLWSYPMLLLLAFGTWRQGRRRAMGHAPSWKTFSARSTPTSPPVGRPRSRDASAPSARS